MGTEREAKMNTKICEDNQTRLYFTFADFGIS